ncbi:NYN domain-containing protein [Corynebacterium sp. CCM 9203]
MVSVSGLVSIRSPLKVAIIVDGGFYRHRAKALFGEKDPRQRADELSEYCRRHIRESCGDLYRIFYYDCEPSQKVLFHPLTRQQVNLAQTEEYEWMTQFLKELVKRRKVALRRGEELETQNGYNLRHKALKKLCAGSITVQDLTERDFYLDITQKGVDMRIGLDIAALSEAGLVNQIIMISGDSDFVPAAKHARRSGIDFILDPMWARVADSLNEHVDGVRECVARRSENDPLHVGKIDL